MKAGDRVKRIRSTSGWASLIGPVDPNKTFIVRLMDGFVHLEDIPGRWEECNFQIVNCDECRFKEYLNRLKQYAK